MTFFFAVLFCEYLKLIFFPQTVGDFFKELRIGLPLFSSLLLVYQGIKVNKRAVWKTLLLSISVSSILSIALIFIHLPIIYQPNDSGNILSQTGGRLINSNASFGIIGLYLLFDDKKKWYNNGKLPLYTSILSIVSLILTFNRTYLTLLAVGFIYLVFKKFKFKNAIKIIIVPILGLITVYWLYNNFPSIQSQIDKRILSIIYTKTTLEENTIRSNRDVIYKGIEKRITEGYWQVGLPLNRPIFSRTGGYSIDLKDMSVTDTSFVNVLLRYGIVPLLLLIIIFYLLFRQTGSYLYRFSFVLFLIASLNIDSLFRQNSVFFLLIIFLIYKPQLIVKNSFHS